MRSSLCCLSVLAACSADVGGLAGPQPSMPPVKMEVDPPVCDATPDDDTVALARLGLRTAHTIVEGRLGPVVRGADRLRAELEIRAVLRGASFMVGQRVRVELDAALAASLELPGDQLVAFGGNAFPTPDQNGGVSWWSPQVIAPIAMRSALEDLFVPVTPWSAVVQIIAQDDFRTTFSVIEALAGPLPLTFSANWSTSLFRAPFPPPSDAQFVVALTSLSTFPDVILADIADIRPASDEARARLAGATSHPIDGAALGEFAADHRLGWRFHRAPNVAATIVTGVADECCTGAGGTYVAHRIEQPLRQSAPGSRLLRGGHAYYSVETCGSRAILAFDGFGAPPALGCGPSASIDEPIPVARMIAELPDTAAARAKVEGWLAAKAPLYRLHASGPLTVGSPEGPWSAPQTIEQAIVIAWVARLQVVEVTSVAGHHEVTIETTLADDRGSPAPVRRFTMAFTCGDARLLQEGSVWLAPLVMEEEAAFLVPGVLLPDHDTTRRTLQAFLQALQQ